MIFRPGDIPNPNGIGGFTAGGPSPNPGGRPKGAQQIQNRALEMCTRALELLGEIMDGKVDKSIGHLQLAAAQAVLDRGVGRAGASRLQLLSTFGRSSPSSAATSCCSSASNISARQGRNRS
jgi:hypothetical protein